MGGPLIAGWQKEKGFTIFEIMIAIFIFAMLVVLLFNSHNIVLSNTESIKTGMDNIEIAKNCIDRMITDLQSIYLALPPAYSPPDFDDPPDPYRVVGEATDAGAGTFGRLRFTSSAHLSFGHEASPEGIAEIVYYAQEDGDGNVLMRRADNLYPFEEFEENENDPALCLAVRSLTFTYYDEEGAAFEHWDSESADSGYATPRAVGIAMTMGDPSTPDGYETRIHLPIYRRKTE